MCQPDHHRYIAHLLYGPPLQRGRCLVIEDLPTLYDVPLTVRLPQPVRAAYLIPGQHPLSLTHTGDAVSVTVPQVQGMYNGDRARKQTLVDYGFRLPSALDNRPLRFDEWFERVNQCIFLSATPADYEVGISS